MSSTLKAITMKPAGWWPLGESVSGTLTDVSGWGNNGTCGAAHQGISLSHGVPYSTVFEDATSTLPMDIGASGSEKQPFTIMAKIRPINLTSDFQAWEILSQVGSDTGLYVEGTQVYFVLNYLSNEIFIGYDIQIMRRVDVAGVFTGTAILLYVDGKLVSQKSLTSDMLNDTFYSSSTSWLAAGSSDNVITNLALNDVGYFRRALTGPEIFDIYSAGYSPNNTDLSSTSFGGRIYEISKRPLTIFNTVTFSTSADWNMGYTDGVAIKNNQLLPVYDGGVSIPGYWIGSVALSGLPTNLFGVNITWDGISNSVEDDDGEGLVIEISVDQITWETCYRGKNVTSIPINTSTVTIPVIYIRVTFLGGGTVDSACINSITITEFKMGSSATVASSQNLHDREQQWTYGVDINNSYPAQLLSDDWGTKLNTNTFKIKDNSDDTNVLDPKSVEVWIRVDSLTGLSISSNIGSGTTVYLNGQIFSSFKLGEWCVVHYTKSTAISGDVVFTGAVQIGRVSYYDSTLTATDIQNIYNSYVGANFVAADDSSVITIAQNPAGSDLYGHDWSITSSG